MTAVAGGDVRGAEDVVRVVGYLADVLHHVHQAHVHIDEVEVHPRPLQPFFQLEDGEMAVHASFLNVVVEHHAACAAARPVAGLVIDRRELRAVVPQHEDIPLGGHPLCRVADERGQVVGIVQTVVGIGYALVFHTCGREAVEPRALELSIIARLIGD